MQYRTTLQSLRLPVLVGTFVLSTFVLLLSYRNASILRAETLSIAKATVLGDWSHDNASVHANAYQLDAPPEGPPWGAIVSAARSTDDLSWMMFIEQKYVKRTLTWKQQHADAVLQLDHISLQRRQPRERRRSPPNPRRQGPRGDGVSHLDHQQLRLATLVCRLRARSSRCLAPGRRHSPLDHRSPMERTGSSGLCLAPAATGTHPVRQKYGRWITMQWYGDLACIARMQSSPSLGTGGKCFRARSCRRLLRRRAVLNLL